MPFRVVGVYVGQITRLGRPLSEGDACAKRTPAWKAESRANGGYPVLTESHRRIHPKSERHSAERVGLDLMVLRALARAGDLHEGFKRVVALLKRFSSCRSCRVSRMLKDGYTQPHASENHFDWSGPLVDDFAGGCGKETQLCPDARERAEMKPEQFSAGFVSSLRFATKRHPDKFHAAVGVWFHSRLAQVQDSVCECLMHATSSTFAAKQDADTFLLSKVNRDHFADPNRHH